MSRLSRTKIRNAAYAATWAIVPSKLDAILEFLDLRAEGHTLSKRELRERGFSAVAARPGTVEASGQQIAVLPLNGVIAPHAGFEMEMSGGTSTEAFGRAFDGAMANPSVGAIVIRCDSPGGSVNGIPETFAKVFAARGQGKRIIASVDPNCHSAALWICAAADEIVITPSGMIGNIGVMTVRTDTSAMEAKAGIKREIIKAGEFKGEGAPFEPMTDAERSATQALVNEVYASFAGDFAKGRGTTVAAVKAGFGQGRSVTAKTAVAMGMADRIATFEDVIAELGGRSAPGAARPKGMIALRAQPIDETCPDCGTPMEMEDGEPFCPECDGALVTSASVEETRMAALADAVTLIPVVALPLVSAEIAPSTLTASATRPGELIAVSLDAGSPTTTTQDTHMPETPTTPAPDRAAMLAELKAAEKDRRDQITALCTDHGLTLKAAEYINADYTIAQAKDAILAEKKSTTAATRPAINVSGVTQRSDRDPKKGFSNHREFLTAVIKHGARDISAIKDDRLKALAVRDDQDENAGGEVAFMLPVGLKATVGSDEQGNYSDTYGGFASTPTRAPGMLTLTADSDPTVGRTQDVPMASTTVEILARTDKDHSTSVTGGLTFSRKAEAAAASASRMATELVTLKASSLFGLAFATEEVLTDSPLSFAAILDAGFRDQYGAHILNEKLYGLGGSEYQGVLKSPALVSVAKETGQLTKTIVTQNILNMRSRCWGYGQAVWMANHDCLPQLGVLSIGVGAAGVLVYQPSMREDLPDTLLGRPIFYNEFADTVGNSGDLILANWSQYLEGTYQPLQSAESIHVRFVNHERAFKFWTRNAGQGWWRSALTPKKSTKTLSPFVVLDAR